uniref:Uncharacterized protein n=1 Tax=Tanacetum cinerariifolium TaxID=118510 RepID=A0A6L2JT21_TANCI|nr:hypothetical protein [Tanacetum cinerariifolium]
MTTNHLDVVFLLESIRVGSEWFANSAYGFFLGKRVAYPVVTNYFSSKDGFDAMLENGPSFIRNNPLILKKWDSDVNLLQKDVGNVLDECLKNIGLGVAKNLKKHSQAPRGVLITLKVGFKPTKKVYRPISKKPNANTSRNKKKDVEPTKEVSNSNLFNVLNLIENDVGLSTNGGTSNLASKKTNSGGSSFWNVGSSSTTPIVEKVDKIERLIIDGKVTLADDEGKPLEKVDSSGDHDNEDEVESVNNEMASFLASKMVGYGFPAQSVGSSNAIALDSPYLLVLITGTSQSRQHGTTLSTLEVLEGLVLKILGAITLTVCINFDYRVEGAEFEVTGLDKAFILSTLGRTEDFGKGVKE